MTPQSKKLVKLSPIKRSFIQYLGSNGYEPNGMKAKDSSEREYCAVKDGIWAGWLVFRDNDGLWQSGRLLTSDDMKQISEYSIENF